MKLHQADPPDRRETSTNVNCLTLWRDPLDKALEMLYLSGKFEGIIMETGLSRQRPVRFRHRAFGSADANDSVGASPHG